MRYLLAFVFPPAAVLLCGKPMTAALNALLTICCWMPGVLHALAIVKDHKDDGRARRYQSRSSQVVSVNLPPTYPGAK